MDLPSCQDTTELVFKPGVDYPQMGRPARISANGCFAHFDWGLGWDLRSYLRSLAREERGAYSGDLLARME